MARNRKTVIKPFSYLQCDDFADYLSDMAAQGWHFKEWSAGMVFEKGEPEQAVYAVEVFIHGSQYDLKPNDTTLNFSDYCEAAGWKLVDSKMKYCIFKQMRPDAVPIVTPEERLQNAAKAYRGQLIWQVVLSLLWICNLLLRVLPASRLIDTLFSPIDLIFILIWSLFFLYIAGKCIWYALWMHKAHKRCVNGETKLLSHSRNRFYTWLSIFPIAAMCFGFLAAGKGLLLVLTFATAALILLVLIVMAKVRPSRETNIGIQVILPIALIILITTSILITLPISNKNEPSLKEFPLVFEDLSDAGGELEDTFHTSSTSIFGSTSYYSILYENTSISYKIYESEQDWILDLIWEEELAEISKIVQPVECTQLWDAECAYRAFEVVYLVRYDNVILIMAFRDGLSLTQEQVTVIREALGLGG